MHIGTNLHLWLSRQRLFSSCCKFLPNRKEGCQNSDLNRWMQWGGVCEWDVNTGELAAKVLKATYWHFQILCFLRKALHLKMPSFVWHCENLACSFSLSNRFSSLCGMGIRWNAEMTEEGEVQHSSSFPTSPSFL